ncbi:NAD-dependent epimerase/dehydratase family protein [Engelhardtia mirabilis]|uniref:UDP-glucose 4-epimerase n=1 Tax=Engelhardtia mirabilis TaxID=2528011 RepID=A0A518BFM3_9BACT|nr:UDP-glucose 4-epimerase [Planctomycetes bacterium Pla133]QDV00104.1 UDP-glucose 4-epimerase [Planctomycetes bacterium Pla86]
MTRYLVTGGAGFIGSHLTQALIARGDEVRVLDDLSSGRRENLAGHELGDPGSGAPVELLVGDVADETLMPAALEGVGGVFHEAAQVSVPQSVALPVRSIDVNVMATMRLLEAARQAGVERFVLAGSSAAYGDSDELPKRESMPVRPLSPYAVGKVAAEQLMTVYGRLHGMKTVTLRYFNVFGPRQVDDSPYTGVIAIFARALLEGRSAKIFGDGEQTRDFTYIDNVVQANLLAMDRDVEPGSIFNVGGGERISVNQLYARLASLAGSDVKPDYQPARLGDVQHSLASLEAIREQLGYDPKVGWEAGLAPTFEWYRERLGAGV